MGWYGISISVSRAPLIFSGLLCLVWLMVLTAAMEVSAQPAPDNRVYQVDIDSGINPGSSNLLQHAIDTAEDQKATALIVRINTPGGLLSSTRDMVSAIAESRVPVVGYVGPAGASATSAGAFILLSTHVAVMNTGTNVGASSPIAGDGTDIGGTLGKKIMNDSKAFMRSIASSHGRNADAAERFVSEAESLTAGEAQANDLIDLVANDSSELLERIHGIVIDLHGETITLDTAASKIQPIEPRLVDRVLGYVAHPQVAHLLISLGVLAIFIEILSPGLALPGILGAIAVILGLVGAQALPVNIGFLMLLFLGLTLMAAEYFVAGFGVLGIGGAVAFVIGSINLFDVPISNEDHDAILSVSIGVSLAMLLTIYLITRSLLSGKKKPIPVSGQQGQAMVNFDAQGLVLIDDQRWTAQTRTPLHHGDSIVVVGTTEEGMLIVDRIRD